MIVRTLWRRLLSSRGAAVVDNTPRRARLHVLPSTLHELRTVVSARPGRIEPLALLWVRYVSEDNRDIVVGVKVEAFADNAYVDGPNGANFDVHWLMGALDVAARSNAGALLCHEHGHRGKPAFSHVDRWTNESIMAKQRHVNEGLPYGALIVSLDDALGVLAGANGLHRVDVRVMSESIPSVNAKEAAS